VFNLDVQLIVFLDQGKFTIFLTVNAFDALLRCNVVRFRRAELEVHRVNFESRPS